MIGASLGQVTFDLKLIEKEELEIITYFEKFENYDNVLVSRMSNFSEEKGLDYDFKDVIELFREDDGKDFSEDRLIAFLTKYPNIKIDSYRPPQVHVIKLNSGLLIALIILIAILNVFNTNYNDIM